MAGIGSPSAVVSLGRAPIGPCRASYRKSPRQLRPASGTPSTMSSNTPYMPHIKHPCVSLEHSILITLSPLRIHSLAHFHIAFDRQQSPQRDHHPSCSLSYSSSLLSSSAPHPPSSSPLHQAPPPSPSPSCPSPTPPAATTAAPSPRPIPHAPPPPPRHRDAPPAAGSSPPSSSLSSPIPTVPLSTLRAMTETTPAQTGRRRGGSAEEVAACRHSRT